MWQLAWQQQGLPTAPEPSICRPPPRSDAPTVWALSSGSVRKLASGALLGGTRGQPTPADFTHAGYGRLSRTVTSAGDAFLAEHSLDSDSSEVCLDGLGLDAIPEGVFALLSGLRRIDLSGNALADLPNDFGSLSSLERLDLSGNRFESIPEVIRTCASISELLVARCGLLSLPDWIGDLHALQVLDLQTNFIEALPTAMAQLENLRILVLSENFGLVPDAQCAGWPKLQELRVRSNALSDLPRGLIWLSDDVYFDASDNPLDPAIESLVEQGFASLKMFLRHVDRVPNVEAKLILVGEGNVGKSTLVDALQGKPFKPDRSTTHGIEISTTDVVVALERLPMVREWRAHYGSKDEISAGFDLPIDLTRDAAGELSVPLRTWDFGGQEVYRITHQFFFSDRAVYLVVWRPREGVDANAVEYWIRRIRLRVGPGVQVIVVATHADERFPEVDTAYLRRLFPDTSLSFLAVDSRSGAGIAQLRVAIADAAARLPHLGESMPRTWRRGIESLPQIKLPYLTYDQFVDHFVRVGIAREDIPVFARLLHDLGHVLYFGDSDALRGLVVLQPEWLSKAIGVILEDDAIRDANGVADHSHLSLLWAETAIASYPRELHPYFLMLMERFDISYRIPNRDASLIAQLVPVDTPDIDWSEGVEGQIRVICDFTDEPVGLMSWLTVRTHQWTTDVHWRRGVFLRHPRFRSEALIVQTALLRVEIIVRSRWPALLLGVLHDTLSELVETRWSDLQFSTSLPCPWGDERGCSGRFELGDILGYLADGIAMIRCHRCRGEFHATNFLVGFPGLHESASSQISRALEEVRQLGRATAASLERLVADVRVLRKAAALEVIDTPRLFEMRAVDFKMWNPKRALAHRYRIRLWCEAPGSEHACGGDGYDFEPTREWLGGIAPYVQIIGKTLAVLIPVAGTTTTAIANDKAIDDFAEVLAVMGALGAAAAEMPSGESQRDAAPGQLTSAEGAGLRQFRALIRHLDPGLGFQGLSRVQAPDGEFLWVCADHLRSYQPDLPTMTA